MVQLQASWSVMLAAISHIGLFVIVGTLRFQAEVWPPSSIWKRLDVDADS